VNTLNSPERERLLEEFRCNNKYNDILDYFENRILFVDIRQEENLDEYSFGSTKYIQYKTLNDIINERKQTVYKHLNKFIEYFFPGKNLFSWVFG
jgi:transcription initiation factor IIE alpha subunit